MKLSHSAREKYELCPRKYKHHYIDRLRSPKIPSPLFFGSALDEAFSHLLLQKKEVLTDIELDMQLKQTPEELFQQKMLEISHNGEIVKLAQNPFADYYTSDFSPELLNKSHLPGLKQLEPAYGLVDFIDFHLQCKEQLAARKRLQGDDQILYNYLSWLSLTEKGKLMISAYQEQVIPQIHRVYDIQKSISLKNEDGDEITGLIDFTASFTDSPSVKYVNDNKTSSKPYKADSVQTSDQLATYCEAEETDKASYVVIEKKLFKKQPNIRCSVIKDTIPAVQFDKTFDKFEETVYNIERQHFPQNWDSCYAFGRPCEYLQLCKHNDSSNLIKVDKKVEIPEEEEL